MLHVTDSHCSCAKLQQILLVTLHESNSLFDLNNIETVEALAREHM